MSRCVVLCCILCCADCNAQFSFVLLYCTMLCCVALRCTVLYVVLRVALLVLFDFVLLYCTGLCCKWLCCVTVLARFRHSLQTLYFHFLVWSPLDLSDLVPRPVLNYLCNLSELLQIWILLSLTHPAVVLCDFPLPSVLSYTNTSISTHNPIHLTHILILWQANCTTNVDGRESSALKPWECSPRRMSCNTTSTATLSFSRYSTVLTKEPSTCLAVVGSVLASP